MQIRVSAARRGDGINADALRATARAAQEVGYHSVWVPDDPHGLDPAA